MKFPVPSLSSFNSQFLGTHIKIFVFFKLHYMAEQIPHELMVEILSRLPAKSLCRFRCVCKPWCNLFFDSEFIQMHLTQATQRDDPHLLALRTQKITNMDYLKHRGTPMSFYHQPYIYWVEDYSFYKCLKIKVPLVDTIVDSVLDFMSEILGSCNGIVCLVKGCQACLLNPCTREYKIVTFDNGVNIHRKTTSYGFGYDPSGDNYKLVQIVDGQDICDSQISVYSVNDTSCSKISNVPYRISKLDKQKQSGIYLNGAIYWIATSIHDEIICFDVGTEVVTGIPIPDNLDGDALIALAVVGGELAMLKWLDKIATLVMKTFDARVEWCKITSIVKQIDSWECVYHSWRIRPLQFTINDVEGHTTGILNALKERIVTHVPTLISLKSGTYLDTITQVDAARQT